MTIQVISGRTTQELIDNFLVQVNLGKRFKCVAIPDEDKDSIVSITEYLKYNSIKTARLSSTGKTYIQADDSYVLPSNVVAYQSLNNTPLTLGVMLMAIQHTIASGGSVEGLRYSYGCDQDIATGIQVSGLTSESNLMFPTGFIDTSLNLDFNKVL